MNRRDRERGREEKTHTAFSSFSFLLNQTTESKRKTWRTALEKKKRKRKKESDGERGRFESGARGLFCRALSGRRKATNDDREERRDVISLAHAFLLSSLSRAASSAVERDNAGERASERKGAPFCACACNDFEMLRVCKRKKRFTRKTKKKTQWNNRRKKNARFFSFA